MAENRGPSPLDSVDPLNDIAIRAPREMEANQNEKNELPIDALWISIRAEVESCEISRPDEYRADSLSPNTTDRNTADSSNLLLSFNAAEANPTKTNVKMNM